MKFKSLVIGMVGVLASGCLNAVSAAESSAATPPTTLTGQYIWDKQPAKPGELKAVLTPDGPQQWKAVYTFLNPQSKSQTVTYTGTLKGDLQNGPVTGTAVTDGGRRTFAIHGTANNGVLTFNHSETSNGNIKPTGTGRLKVVSTEASKGSDFDKLFNKPQATPTP